MTATVQRRPTSSMCAMLRELYFMSGDRTLSALADRASGSPAGAKRTLIALEDRGWAREHLFGTYSITPEGQHALEAEDDRRDAEVSR